MVMQFGNMIKKMSRIPPLHFNGYGNYCGMFGSGREMDNIDRYIQLNNTRKIYKELCL